MAETKDTGGSGSSDNGELSLAVLLKTMIHQGATDLHLSAGSTPLLRLDGGLVPLETRPLTQEDTRRLCESVLTDSQKKAFEEELELDLSFGVKDLARFRANIYMQRGAVALALRTVPFEVKSLAELGSPEIMGDLASRKQGLVLVTGPTGSGKSTTLAAMVDHVNRERRGHIITIEDPIEYLHPNKGCLVNQRELGTDTTSFSRALKSVLRQDPDVVLIGEMRDLETIEAALTISETGHLALGTLHTNSCTQTINRIIDVFPSHQQSQVRQVLSFVLEGIICQQLVPRVGGGVALASEVLVCNNAIRNLIREDKMSQVYSHMQVGQAKYGMHTMNQSLCNLVGQGDIEREEALARTSELDELVNLMG